MITISKQFDFAASHCLEHLPNEHPCARMHGHNYTLTVYLQGDVNQDGFVLDYRKLKPVKDYIAHTLDHRNLNDVLPCKTTVEEMCVYLFNELKKLVPKITAIELSETPKTRCYYEP